MKRKAQIFLVHGGMTFKRKKDYLRYLRTRPISIVPHRSWSSDSLEKDLGAGFEVVKPRMPLAENAKYEDWKIYFERFVPFMRSGVILIGSSLGGIFLAKYLSEHKFKKRIGAVYLVAPPFDDTVEGEDLAGGFRLKTDMSLFERNARHIRLYFSGDDPSVLVSHAEKYAKKLPGAKIRIFKSKKGHFGIGRFPELVRDIKEL